MRWHGAILNNWCSGSGVNLQVGEGLSDKGVSSQNITGFLLRSAGIPFVVNITGFLLLQRRYTVRREHKKRRSQRLPAWYTKTVSAGTFTAKSLLPQRGLPCSCNEDRDPLVFYVVVTNFVKKVHSVKQAQANNDGEASKRNKNHRVV